MQKRLSLVTLSLLMAAAACSRSSTAPSSARVGLTGTVYAAATATPLRDVRVAVVDGPDAGRETSSDGAGVYRFEGLAAGAVTLKFTSSGYVDLQRALTLAADATLDVRLERGPLPGVVLSGRVTTLWGMPIDDVGVEAVHDGRVAGGGTTNRSGVYSIPTLPAQDYDVRAIKFGYVTPHVGVTLTANATLDIAMDRVRVALTGRVLEAPPCAGAIDGARVEIADGPDAGAATTSTTSGYRIERLNWGGFRVRASKAGYVAAEVSLDVLSPGSGSPQAPAVVLQDLVLARTGGC